MPSRVWLIGNGASLKQTPYHLLKNEQTFGLNRNHWLDFKPNRYLCVDTAEGDTEWQKAVQYNKDAQLYLWDGLRSEHTYTPIHRCRHHFYALDNVDKRVQSWHLPEICTALGSISVMMQIAVLEGFDEIYLIGCDLWKEGQNHYTDQYVTNEDIKRRNADALYLHQVAKASCPIPIVNCTVGGQLEVYPRADMRDILKG